MNKEFFDVDNKYLANGIAYGTGNRYHIIKNYDNNIFYRFKYSEEVYNVFKSLISFRKEYNKYNN